MFLLPKELSKFELILFSEHPPMINGRARITKGNFMLIFIAKSGLGLKGLKLVFYLLNPQFRTLTIN